MTPNQLKLLLDNGYTRNIFKHCDLYTNDDYGLNAEEDTLAILGGVGGADASKENLIYYLDKYKFKHKEVEQLSLW